MNSAAIAIILPLRERFRPADAGAIALLVYDFVRASRFCQQTVVLGKETEPFADVNYHYAFNRWSPVIGYNNAYFYACRHWLAQHQPQLVEVHNRITLALRIKATFPHIRVVVYLHNEPQTMEGAKTTLQRQHLLNTLDAVYCVSEYVKTRFLDDIVSELSQKVYVIHNALAQTTQQIALHKKPWLVYAGRFVPEKGVLELAQALADVLPRFSQWQAVFIGAKGFGHVAGRSKYEQQVYAALAPVAKQVTFTGHVPQTEVMSLLAQSSVAVVPSIYGEAFGRVAIEAMSMANAVVVSNYGALPEVAGNAAIVLPNMTKDCITQTLSNLLADSSRITLVASACQQRARDFSIQKQAGLLDDIRQQLIG